MPRRGCAAPRPHPARARPAGLGRRRGLRPGPPRPPAPGWPWAARRGAPARAHGERDGAAPRPRPPALVAPRGRGAGRRARGAAVEGPPRARRRLGGDAPRRDSALGRGARRGGRGEWRPEPVPGTLGLVAAALRDRAGGSRAARRPRRVKPLRRGPGGRRRARLAGCRARSSATCCRRGGRRRWTRRSGPAATSPSRVPPWRRSSASSTPSPSAPR